MKYWIGVVSKDHVDMGVSEGILQIGHGKLGPLSRIHKDDWLIYYSPKKTLSDKEPLQAFTALGQVLDEEIYQVKINDNFNPYRRKIKYLKINQTQIKPLIDELDFIKSKKNWGYNFRFGLLEITKKDFDLIKENMLN